MPAPLPVPEWRPIPGYSGYEATACGRVRSVRTWWHPRGCGAGYARPRELRGTVQARKDRRGVPRWSYRYYCLRGEDYRYHNLTARTIVDLTFGPTANPQGARP